MYRTTTHSSQVARRPWWPPIVALVILGLAVSPAWAQQQPPAGAKQPPGTAKPPAAKPKVAAPVDPAEAAAAAAAAARAQAVKNADLFKATHAKLKPKFAGAVRAGDITEADKPIIEDYYSKWVELFAMPGADTQLPELRDKIKKETRIWGNAGDKKKALDYVNNLLLNNMEALVGEAKAPAVARYNALLVIGDLNDVESNSGLSLPVTPMAAALPVLHKALADTDAIDAVKVAALVGLMRHVDPNPNLPDKNPGIADKNLEKKIVADLLALIEADATPEGRTADGHHWMRRRAMELLSTLIKPGPSAENQRFTAALKKVLANEDHSMVMRSDAALALGKIGAADPEVVPALAKLLMDVTRQEATRRGMKHYLQSMHLGLNGHEPKAPADPKGPGELKIPGIAKSLPPAQKKHADELAEMLAEVVRLLEKIGDDLLIPQRMPEEGDKIEIWLAKTYNIPVATTTP